MICPNCGAQIEEHVTKCPHCGYINIEGAQEQYLKELEEIKDNLSDVKNEPAKALKKGMKRGVRVVLYTVGVLATLAIIYSIFVSIALRNHPKMFMSAEEKASASAYRAVAEEKLAVAYENKDIEQMAQIFDVAYYEDRVSLWGDPHYEAAYAASLYMKLQKSLPNLDKKKIKKKEAEEITYYCFYFYYRAYGEDGAPIFDSLRDSQVMPIIEDRLGYTIEDMENFRDKVLSPPNVNRSNVYYATRKYYKYYR